MQAYQFFSLMGLICWGFGLFRLIQAYFYYQQFNKARQDWPESLARVTERKINQNLRQFGKTVPFWVEIKYSYAVIGSNINGLMVKRPRLYSTDLLVKIFNEYPPGTTFLIRYNPEKPTMHITEFDKFIFDWGRIVLAFTWGTMILCAASGLLH
jgi:hypothetical protein